MRARNYVNYLLNEFILREESTQTTQTKNKNDLLGNFAFATQRNAQGEKVPNEPNNEYEEKLLKDIEAHLSPDNSPLSPTNTKNILKFMSDGSYKKVFRPAPSGADIFRGETKTIEGIKKILGVKKIPGLKGEMKVNYTWNPRRGAGYGASWTTNYKIAQEFSRDNRTDERPMELILTAAPGQEEKFLNVMADEGKYSGLYRFTNFAFQRENEVISLGPIQIAKVEWELSEFYLKPEMKEHFVGVPDDVWPLTDEEYEAKYGKL